MKQQVLFSLINNEKVFMNVVCCSRDWLFKGYGEEWKHFQGKQLNFHFAFRLDGGQLSEERVCSCWSKFFPLRADLH